MCFLSNRTLLYRSHFCFIPITRLIFRTAPAPGHETCPRLHQQTKCKCRDRTCYLDDSPCYTNQLTYKQLGKYIKWYSYPQLSEIASAIASAGVEPAISDIFSLRDFSFHSLATDKKINKENKIFSITYKSRSVSIIFCILPFSYLAIIINIMFLIGTTGFEPTVLHSKRNASL